MKSDLDYIKDFCNSSIQLANEHPDNEFAKGIKHQAEEVLKLIKTIEETNYVILSTTNK